MSIHAFSFDSYLGMKVVVKSKCASVVNSFE